LEQLSTPQSNSSAKVTQQANLDGQIGNAKFQLSFATISYDAAPENQKKEEESSRSNGNVELSKSTKPGIATSNRLKHPPQVVLKAGDSNQQLPAAPTPIPL